MSARKGTCAVRMCRRDGTVGLVLGREQYSTPVCDVCDHHAHELGDLESSFLDGDLVYADPAKVAGWRLYITLAGNDPTLYPPGVPIPEPPYRPLP